MGNPIWEYIYLVIVKLFDDISFVHYNLEIEIFFKQRITLLYWFNKTFNPEGFFHIKSKFDYIMIQVNIPKF